MEVCTTSNNSSEHHLAATTTTSSSMLRGSPFQREVREWQRIDPTTGALLSGRLEADRWINGPLNSYGKKSSSSVSSNSNSSTASNMHLGSRSSISNSNRNGGKISLHTIVGSGNNNDTFLSSSSTSSSSALQQQQQRSSRLYEQHPTFGKINSSSSSSSSFIKSRVGGNSSSSSIEAATNDAELLSSVSEKQQQRQPQTLTPTQLYRQQRRDLESFRHYNDDQHNDDEGGDADVLRLSERSQRRQQIPDTSLSTLQRGRSISTDDLSTEWDPHGDHSTYDEPSEWRRVSKLRRSFQSPATKTNSDSYATTTTTLAPRRPLDLPESSVSVSKIRAELEAGRRLTTAMRNNHVDLAALQNILDAPTDNKPATAKRSTFLTAESLKEIRGKLKKLSDESLYKEDFITHQNEAPAQVEHIEVQHIRKPSIMPQVSTTQRRSLISPDKSPEIQRSAFQFVTPQPNRTAPLVASNTSSSSSQKHTTNSLESRLKSRDTTSAEWHLRRKSYGFEKMSPPDDKSMFRMDASTDSGLGRSGELSNWSPTEASTATRATVVQFGEPARLVSNAAAIHRRQRPLRTSDPDDSSEELKRHSIAVDESQYMRKASQVHLNGTVTESVLLEATRYDTDSPPNSSQLFQRSTQQKRVEFCKTEVHFAAESGRVNIVETDGKPPPTNNFRRRRRTASGPLESLVKVAGVTDLLPTSSGTVTMPTTRFGDDNRPRTISSSTVAYKAALVDAATAEVIEPSSVTVSLPKEPYGIGEGSRSSYASTSGVDTTDNENDEIAAIRGILKNKPVKPKPYHLGENFESPDALWGVQLKPIGSLSPLPSRREDYDVATKASSPPAQALHKSVAERVRIVERRHDTATSQAQCNGYSTKINLSLGDTSPERPPEQGANYFTAMQPNTNRRPSAQELLLQDLKEHQKILDEGLKSTSLIIKTMRSANEFDEAMRRLSIASIESTVMPHIVLPTPMLRSNSYQDTSQQRYATATPIDENEQTVIKSASYSSASSLLALSRTSSRRYSTDSQYSLCIAAPTAAPRLKLIGNAEVPVSQQLSQLRRLYEVAAAQDGRDADSADEEVKHYFRGQVDNSDSGGGTQESSSLEDERAPFEYSSSWSRLKAKRTVWKIEAEEEKAGKQQQQDTPKTNIMNIELHSPQATFERPEKATPVAKPRTLPSANIQQYEPDSSHSIHTTKEHLKIIKEARGARKLREHELSYFGVQVPTANSAKTKVAQTPTQTTNPRRTLPQRHRVQDDTTKPTETRNETQTTKWNLVNDKPDLLRHSSIMIEPKAITKTAQIKSTDQQQKKMFSPVKRIQYSDDDTDEDDEHFYENITNEISSVITVKPPPTAAMHAYNRKTDLERDQRILSEMTHTADQTMKALTDEAAIKDQRRRSSLTRRNVKPLETITEKVNDSCIAVKVARSTLASEAKRTSRHSTPSPTPVVICSRMRTSSQSSNESCSRARSRSLSSEREYENVKVRPTTRSTKMQKPATKPSSRSSSRDSQRSSHTPQGSSGDDQQKQNCRRDERLRTKTKRISSSSLTKAQQEARRQREHERTKEQQQRAMRASATTNASTHKEKSKSASTTRSSQRERVECATTDSSRRHRRDNELDPHRRSSSSRRSTATAEKHDEKRSGNRLVRSMRTSSHHHHPDDAAQRSSSRSERSTKDKDKEKLSRSKGHSSQSTQQHSSGNEHSHHQHQHNSSPSSSSANKVRHHASNSSEHKKSKSGTAHHESPAVMTHSKNTQNVNGISAQYHQQHQQQQQQQQHYHHHPQQHVHSMTTATITAKQRERHSKDRK